MISLTAPVLELEEILDKLLGMKCPSSGLGEKELPPKLNTRENNDLFNSIMHMKIVTARRGRRGGVK